MKNSEFIKDKLADFIDSIRHCQLDCQKCVCLDYCYNLKRNNLTTKEWLEKEYEE